MKNNIFYPVLDPNYPEIVTDKFCWAKFSLEIITHKCFNGKFFEKIFSFIFSFLFYFADCITIPFGVNESIENLSSTEDLNASVGEDVFIGNQIGCYTVPIEGLWKSSTFTSQTRLRDLFSFAADLAVAFILQCIKSAQYLFNIRCKCHSGKLQRNILTENAGKNVFQFFQNCMAICHCFLLFSAIFIMYAVCQLILSECPMSQHTWEACGQPLPQRKTPWCSGKTQTLTKLLTIYF